MDREQLRKTIKKLSVDSEKHCSIINFMKNNKINEIEQVDESFLIRGSSDRDWVYLALSEEAALSSVLKRIRPTDKCFAVIENEIRQDIVKDRKILWELNCVKHVYSGTKSIPERNAEIVVRSLHAGEADYIYENYEYNEFTDVNYIRDRIESGLSLGVDYGDQLVAWIMTHDDGAMGMLTVLEDYRKKGYAAQLTVEMIKMLRERNEVPFMFIEPDNEKSLNLAAKFGFERKGEISWFEID